MTDSEPRMVVGVDHVSFTVSDLSRSCQFYSLVLEAEPLSVGADDSEVAARVIGYEHVSVKYAYYALPGSHTILELFEYALPVGAASALRNCDVGNGHLGLIVHNLDVAYRRLTEVGAVFTQPAPVTIDTGPWQGSKAIYMRDPDGITIELLESPPPAAARFA